VGSLRRAVTEREAAAAQLEAALREARAEAARRGGLVAQLEDHLAAAVGGRGAERAGRDAGGGLAALLPGGEGGRVRGAARGRGLLEGGNGCW
jgi:hypothetical protein